MIISIEMLADFTIYFTSSLHSANANILELECKNSFYTEKQNVSFMQKNNFQLKAPFNDMHHNHKRNLFMPNLKKNKTSKKLL